ncbi:MAG: hypothetical protein ABI132_01670 [Rhodanobacteraceae bacterium]
MINRDAMLRFTWLLLSLLYVGWYFSSAYNPPLIGDGQEYYLVTEALLHHGSPELRDTDLQRAAALHDNQQIASNAKWIQTAHSDAAKDTLGTGYFRSRDGSYFSWHFWLYPSANVPAMALCDALGLSPTTSFVITNCLAVLTAVIFALFLSGYPLRKSVLTVTVILLAGAFYFAGDHYFVGWTDPTVFCLALLFIGLICCDIGKPLAGALMFAFAAQQNPPIGILAAAALTWSIQGRLRHDSDRRSRMHYWANVGVVTCVLFLSPLFYLWAFGEPSLIASPRYHATDPSLITVHRLMSLYFDPHQSVLMQVPAVFIVLPLAYLGVIATRLQNATLHLWLAGLILASALMALPSLTTTSWAVGINRYAVLVAAPLLFAAMLALTALPPRLMLALATAFVVIQICSFRVQAPWGSQINPEVKWVLRKHPDLYNPVPGLLLYRDSPFAIKNTYMLPESRDRQYAYIAKGHITKVLEQEGAVPWHLPCPRSEMGTPYHIEQGWEYLTPPRTACPIVDVPEGLYAFPAPELTTATRVFFGDAHDGYKYLGPGFSGPEPWGTWSSEPRAVLYFQLNPALLHGASAGYRLNLGIQAYSPPGAWEQIVDVRVNGTSAANWHLTQRGSASQSVVVSSQSAMKFHGLVFVTFSFSNVSQPKTLTDRRRFAMKIFWLNLQKI